MTEGETRTTTVELTPSGARGQRIPKPARRLMAALMGLTVWLYRRSPSRIRGAGLPTLLLTTLGARSGKRRTALLGHLADGPDAWLVIGSMGGAATHPSWIFNLAKHPDQAWVEVGTRRLRVRAESLRGEALDTAWRRIAVEAPGYDAYRSKTDREIPIIRLSAFGPRS